MIRTCSQCGRERSRSSRSGLCARCTMRNVKEAAASRRAGWRAAYESGMKIEEILSRFKISRRTLYIAIGTRRLSITASCRKCGEPFVTGNKRITICNKCRLCTMCGKPHADAYRYCRCNDCRNVARRLALPEDVAELRAQGYSMRKCAAAFGCSTSAIQRALKRAA